MGKQSKLKKNRKSGQNESVTQLSQEDHRDRFIEHIEKQGYSNKFNTLLQYRQNEQNRKFKSKVIWILDFRFWILD